MKTESVVSNVTIHFSSEPVLTLPKSIGRELGVRKGEQVNVDVRNGTIRVRKNGKRKQPMRPRVNAVSTKKTASIMDWAGCIKNKSGKTIVVEDRMTHHGYEQLEEKIRKGL